jgi:hypothetical protein
VNVIDTYILNCIFLVLGSDLYRLTSSNVSTSSGRNTDMTAVTEAAMPKTNDGI